MIEMKTFRTREEWLEARTSYIGGSDASSVIGNNPYRSNVELWLQKTGRAEKADISEKPYVRYGTEAEEPLRKLFELDYPEFEVGYAENNIWLNDEYPWAHASLDGWLTEKETGRKGILEIKTSNILQSIQKEKWKDQIPDNYYAQVLHYLAVTGFDFVILKAQLKYDYGDGKIFLNTMHYQIERDECEEDIAYLMQEEEKFYQYILKDKEPPLVFGIV